MNENLTQESPKPSSKLSLIILLLVVLAITGYFASAYYFSLWPFSIALKGTDSNHDSVRDDVEQWINTNFASEQTRAALRQTTIGTQNAILSITQSESQKAAEEELAGSRCLGFLLGAGSAYDVSLQLDNQILNTRARQNAYQKSSLRVNTNLLTPPGTLADRNNFCAFDVSPK